MNSLQFAEVRPYGGTQTQKDRFFRYLPKKPYCTSRLDKGVRIRTKKIAEQHRYIQFNSPHSLKWIVLDIDHDRFQYIADAWQFGVPEPHILCRNPKNGHVHLYYALQQEVHNNPDSKRHPIDYYHKIKDCLTAKLNADPHYVGLVAKNPLNKWWDVQWNLTGDLYDLGYIADHLNLKNGEQTSRPISVRDAVQIALFKRKVHRNVSVFDDLRKWSYRAISKFDYPEYATWEEICLKQADKLNNAFAKKKINLLGEKEIRFIAVSVARWTHKHFTKAEFSAKQSYRGKLKGQKRRDEYLNDALSQCEDGKSLSTIARSLDVAKSTLAGWLSDSPESKRVKSERDALRTSNTEKALKLRNNGLSIRRIAELLEIPKSTIQRLLAMCPSSAHAYQDIAP